MLLEFLLQPNEPQAWETGKTMQFTEHLFRQSLLGWILLGIQHLVFGVQQKQREKGLEGTTKIKGTVSASAPSVLSA